MKKIKGTIMIGVLLMSAMLIPAMAYADQCSEGYLACMRYCDNHYGPDNFPCYDTCLAGFIGCRNLCV